MNVSELLDENVRLFKSSVVLSKFPFPPGTFTLFNHLFIFFFNEVGLLAAVERKDVRLLLINETSNEDSSEDESELLSPSNVAIL